jgi:hypothetical protein
MLHRVLLLRAALACALLAPATLPQGARPSGASAPLRGEDIVPTPLELAGKAIVPYPYFQTTRTFNEGEPIWIAIDPRSERGLARRTLDVHVLAHERLAAHMAGEKLGAPTLRVQVEGDDLRSNTFLVDPGTLSGKSDTDEHGTFVLGRGYDIVLDVDGNGRLDSTDRIDGGPQGAGLWVVEDFVTLSEGSLATGPYPVVEVLFDGGSGFLRQNVFYPRDVAALGELPLVVVSHGNGHNYTWYDHIGFQLASWGYVVMSHTNNTGPGIETASTSTLQNTELFLARLEDIGEGELVGHVDARRIAWMGHSRGGEGVVRAYRRLQLGTPLATLYTLDDIRLVSSIAPTDFLGPNSSNMGAAPYHLWTGGADADVNGCADCNICQTFHLLERADGSRFSTSLHGAGHGDFHNLEGSSSVANGPCRLGRPNTHAIMRGYLLPLLQFNLHGNVACLDYLTRQYEEFRATGTPDPNQPPFCAVVDLMYVPGPERERLVIDDFQSNSQRNQSSSGGQVARSSGLDDTLAEGRYDDLNTTFTANAADTMNGMTLAGPSDTSAGAVLSWNHSDEWLIFEVPADARDLRAWQALSFRGAQATRDPRTVAELGDLDFSVTLLDQGLHGSTIRIGAYGGGLEEPYQRNGCGTGFGWANEFETLRIPLADFRRAGTRLDLGNVVAIAFQFGPSFGSPAGRIALDEILLSRD